MKRLRPATSRTTYASSSKSPTTSEQQARDVLDDRMLFLNINADPGATSKQKSFANDILRNELSPGVADRGGSAKMHRYLKLYQEQCLKATLGAYAKAHASMHLSAGGMAHTYVQGL